MSRPKALVLRTAGINCDGETVQALTRAGARTDLVHLNRILGAPERLSEYALIAIPGGFSYGDDVAAGRVFGLELRHHMNRELAAFVERGGFVLGVCNGFQVLLETGLFGVGAQGGDGERRDVTLSGNASNRFECRWVTIRSEPCAAAWLSTGELLPVPVAHGEGRFVARDPRALERLRARGQIALRYVAPDGGPAAYPDNPNGSADDIAGICDPTGRVLGLMPHPERNVTPWHHPEWTRLPRRDEGEGLSFYRRLVEAAAGAPV